MFESIIKEDDPTITDENFVKYEQYYDFKDGKRSILIFNHDLTLY
ncbi:MAG: hypothetical protein AABY32_01425 [Nanoarchaeota archaeon]